jgi:hypothetical protein
MMKHVEHSLPFAALAVIALASNARAASSPPNSPHPRLFLTAARVSVAAADATKAGSAASALVARCQETIDHPEYYEDRGGADGDNWPGAAIACAFAWKVTGEQRYLDSAISYWNTSLNDDQTRGDGQGCVEGASPDAAKLTVTHDTGYPMRWYGPYLAMAYDWLHDAPGVDAALLTHSRFCFKAWVDYYDASGYLHDVPGANYGAGYVAGKTLIAIAEAGEDGATSDAMWQSVVDDMFGKMLVGRGLAGSSTPVGTPAGPLVGGDWSEGWQYGPLSVLEYALAARALSENGAPQPEMDQWASDVGQNYIYAQSPARDAFYSDGDLESDTVYPKPRGRILRTVLGGTTNGEALGFARFMLDTQQPEGGDHPFEAVADAIGAGVTATNFDTAGKPVWYLARGTRRVYARSSFTDKNAPWSVFTSGGNLVPDHDHFDAGNFVLSRGSDYLVVDPSGYGARTTLASNAPTVAASTVTGDYSPSQTPWSDAELLWARGVASGVCAARGDYAKAFNFTDIPSDIPFARREWVFLPEGEVALIDRVRANDASEGTMLNFHTQGPLTLTGDVATASTGSSDLAIHRVALSGGVPEVHSVPAVKDCYTGSCTGGRFDSYAYSVTIPGPKALAVHVLDALPKGAHPATVGSLNDAPYDNGGDNAAVLGAAILRDSQQSYVVASSAQDGNAGSTLKYGVPGGSSARHVVFDAPEDTSGKSDVTTAVSGGRCSVTITPGAGYAGRPLMFRTSSAAEGCRVTVEAQSSTPPAGSGGSGAGGADNAGGGNGGADTFTSGGATGTVSGGYSAGMNMGQVGVGGASDAGAGGTDAGVGDTSSSGGAGCSAAAGARPGAGSWLLAALSLLSMRRRRAREGARA